MRVFPLARSLHERLSQRVSHRHVGLFVQGPRVKQDATALDSRDDRRLKAIPVPTSAELLARVEIGVQVVGIDEVQFFDDGVVDVCMQLADAGIRVIAAGLDQDYMRRPFGPMPALLAVAEEVSKMHAVCVRCRGAAHYSQRVSGGDAQVEVGDSSYEARCRSCFEAYRALAQQEPEVQLTMPQPVA